MLFNLSQITTIKQEKQRGEYGLLIETVKEDYFIAMTDEAAALEAYNLIITALEGDYAANVDTGYLHKE